MDNQHGQMDMESRSPLTVVRSIIRYSESGVQSVEDTVATEFPVTLFVNGKEFATVVCTPQYLDDLAVGFVSSEGVIRSVEEIESLEVSLTNGVVRMETTRKTDIPVEWFSKRTFASCCGKGRPSFYYVSDAHIARPIEDEFVVTPEEIFTWLADTYAAADVFHRTGAVHVAGVRFSDGTMLTRMDIGRHNALDKLYGHILQNGRTVSGAAVTFSGRLSSEVLLKVAKMGIGIVMTKSAPTELAIRLADELGITAIGFVRGSAFNVYTHPWRVRNGS